MNLRPVCTVMAWICLACFSLPALSEPFDEQLETIKSVGQEGQGNPQAIRALESLRKADAEVLPDILRAFENASPLAANWLRSVFESIIDREIQAGGQVPRKELEQFIQDREQDPRARRLAYEWLKQIDPDLEDRLIPDMLDDPSPDFRRDAVQRLIDEAGELNSEQERDAVVAVYRKALEGAVDDDQVKAIVEPLKELGIEVDLQQHFGFLVKWRLIGPFDNRERIGFEAVYPPEEGVHWDATYEGQLGEVQWQPLSTDHPYGIVDIAEQISPFKGAVMYAATEFVSDREQEVEIRLGTPNAWKVWVNGELLFAREEYHRGMSLDQYRVQATMRPGKNVILLKVCQNEQTENWAQRYQYQLRVCTPTGNGLKSKAEPFENDNE